MRLQAFCYVQKGVVDTIKALAERSNGKLVNKPLEVADKSIFSDPKFKVVNGAEFVSMEFVFDNMFDANQFIYQSFMRCGYYIFIENLIFIN